MSILRTILSRPRRSHDADARRASARYAPVIAVVLGISACTAVAADGLPVRPGSQPGVSATGNAPEVTELAKGPASPELDDPLEVDPIEADPVDAVAPGRPAPEVATPPADAGPTGIEGAAGRGTVVAHAISATVVARRLPAADAETVGDFANPTDRGGPLVFQAVGEPQAGWLEVLLPVRPNGTTGWVDLDDVTLTRNPYRIEVDLASYELTVRRFDEVEISAPVAVGQGGTPTPVGDFYLIELLQPPQANGPYGSYAYGLSGYSDVLDNFNGGEGVIGIHGTNRPDLLGGPASHGCIRIHNDTIELMADFLPLGTPVSIIEAEGG